MKANYLIFDTNGLFHIVYEAITKQGGLLQERVAQKNVYKYLLLSVVNLTNRICERYGGEDSIKHFLFDNHHSKEELQNEFIKREDIFEGYKKNRKKLPNVFFNTIDLFEYYIKLFPSTYRVSRISNLEADDLVKSTLSKIDPKNNAIMVTTDMDWARYLSSNVFMYDPRQNILKTPETFKEKYGFEAKENKIVFFKSLKGDESDNIPNPLLNLHKNELLLLIEDFHDVFDLYSSLSSIPYLSEQQKKELLAKESVVKTNHQLVSVIPVKNDIFDKNTWIGVDNEKVRNAIFSVLSDPHLKNKTFEFGAPLPRK